MITAYVSDDALIQDVALLNSQEPPKGTIWLDLHDPEDHERAFIARTLGIQLPTVEDLQGIEASNRLHTKSGITYLTLDVLVGAEGPHPVLGVLLIVVTSSCLVTMRFCQPQSINNFVRRIKQQPELFATVQDGLLSLLDAITDRIADILEVLGKNADTLSLQVFRHDRASPEERRLQEILQNIGRVGDATHKIRDSISGFSRLVAYLGPILSHHLKSEQLSKFHSLERDVASLSEHTQFVMQETSFLLDATLGQINIEQNNVIKILSIVMVALTPPTFFASMWGMNFHDMPEYNWAWGYPLALGVMVVSAVVPLWYFRKRKWL